MLQHVKVMLRGILGLVPAKLARIVGDLLALGVYLKPVGKLSGSDMGISIAAVDAIAVSIDVDETVAADPLLPLLKPIEKGG